MSKEKLNKLLGELKTEYLKAFPAKLEKIKEYTATLNWAELGNEFHKLKGTGKTYGYPELTTLCQKLEFLAEDPLFQKKEIFEKAYTLLNQLHEHYIKNEKIDLEKNPLAREILDYKVEPK